MSTTANKITLLGKEYPVRFGFKFQRLFMEYHRISKLTDYEKKINELTKMDNLESFRVLGSFVKIAIQSATKTNVILDEDDIIDAIIEDNSIMEDLMVIFQAAQPKTNPKAVGKSKRAK